MDVNRILAMMFGKYEIFTGPHIQGDVRGWIWRGVMYLDLAKESPAK